LNRRIYELGKQRFGKAADLRMTRYRSSKRTTIAVDTVMIVTLLKFCQAAEFIEDRNRHLKSLTQVSWGNTPPGGYTPTDFTQERFHLVRGHALTEYFQYLVKYQVIGFREQILCLRGQTVYISGLATATPGTTLLDHPVTLECRKMCTHCVVREIERLGQLFHRVAGTTQQRDDVAACAGKKPLVPV
jgi:hypothetical protein